VDYPRLDTLWQKVWKDVGEAFTNISLMLGEKVSRGKKVRLAAVPSTVFSMGRASSETDD
jgi:hypothetical protein